MSADALPIESGIDSRGIVRTGARGTIGPGAMAVNVTTILPVLRFTP